MTDVHRLSAVALSTEDLSIALLSALELNDKEKALRLADELTIASIRLAITLREQVHGRVAP